MSANMVSRLAFCWRLWRSVRSAVRRKSATSRALRSSGTTKNSSPASGAESKPMTSTGTDGPAWLTLAPVSSVMARMRPKESPASRMSPRSSWPRWTSAVQTAPRPFSMRDSIITPLAAPLAGACNSNSSACRETACSRASTPSPVCADTGTNCTSPPQSSAVTSSRASPVLTCSGSAPSLSILLTATISGTLAARACCTASSVCGMTPSSAATTRIIRSVQLAPRARMAVKAACPGVSRKVILPCLVAAT